MFAMAIIGIYTYSGSKTALLVGYELAVFCSMTSPPPPGALANGAYCPHRYGRRWQV